MDAAAFIRFAPEGAARTLSFPGLGLDFSISRVALIVGPFTIYWYGLIVVTGIALGVFYGVWRAGKFGINRDRMSDIVIYSVLAGMVGARIYYVAFSWDYYKDHLDEIIKIWNGGIAFYGGVIGALLCAYILCRMWKIPMLRGTDAALGGLLLGQSIGRWGNFVNIEAFGGYFEGAWRMVSPAIDEYFHAFPEKLSGFTAEQVLSMTDIPVHPTFFYESAWTMLGFLFIAWYSSRRRFNGELTLMYFFINGLGRFFIEGLRTDSLMLGGVRISQILAAAMVIASAALWVAGMKKVKTGTVPAFMALEMTEEETAAMNAAMLKNKKETAGEAKEPNEGAGDIPVNATSDQALSEPSPQQEGEDAANAQESGGDDGDGDADGEG